VGSFIGGGGADLQQGRHLGGQRGAFPPPDLEK